jgi:oligoribonuclease (3'-5' exoribonuclease)
MGDYTHLLWLDLETTGTDEKQDGIIEAAVILTTTDLVEMDFDEYIVTPTPEQMQRLRDNEFVFNMHSQNGLLGMVQNGAGADAEFTDDQIVRLLEVYEVKPHSVLIAGSGVAHFDRRFVKEHLPRLDRHLAYPAIDVGVLRRCAEMWGFDLTGYPEQETKAHRAMADIRLHLAEARWFQQRFDQRWDGV